MLKRWIVLSVLMAAAVWGGSLGVAQADEPTGQITVQKEIDGEGTLSGWEYTLTSTECGVTETGTTDDEGVVVFTGLPFTVNGVDCLYDVTETSVDGYTRTTPDPEMQDLTPGVITTPTSAEVGLVTVDGIFTGVTRNPESSGNTLEILCLEGVGTSVVRAGAAPVSHVCNDISTRSGLGFEGEPLDVLPTGEVIFGTLTHFNQTIERGLHNADLQLSITLTDEVTGESQTLTRSYTINIDETSDTAQVCKYESEAGDLNHTLPFGFGCADALTITQPGDTTIQLSYAEVDLQLNFGTVNEDGTCSDPVSVAYTAEQTNTPLCLIASTTITPYLSAGTELTVISVADEEPTASATADPSETTASTEPAATTTDDEGLADTGTAEGLAGLFATGLLVTLLGAAITRRARARR